MNKLYIAFQNNKILYEDYTKAREINIKHNDKCESNCDDEISHILYDEIKNYLIDDLFKILYNYMFFEGSYMLRDCTSLFEFIKISKNNNISDVWILQCEINNSTDLKN